MNAIATRPRRSLIPLAFVGAFAVVAAANGALIYEAFRSQPALVSAKSFEEGRAYNRELAAAARQAALGWSPELELAPRAGEPAELVLRFADRDGGPVESLAIAARLVRAVGRDAAIELAPAETAAGRYVAAVVLPAPGLWQLELVARRGEDEFVLARRITAR